MADNSSEISTGFDSQTSNGDNEELEDRDEVFDHIPMPRKASVLKKEGRGPKRSLSKSVSFSSRPEDKKIINAADCLTFIQNGCELMKIRSNSRQYQRFFSLDEDFTTLRWKPSSKKPEKAKINIHSIREIRTGKNTEVFREVDRDDIQEDCAFSVIYGDTFETLNLVAYSPDEANIWVTGLRCLIDSDKAQSPVEHRQQMRDRWLKEQFILADTGAKGRLNEKEVLNVLQQLKVRIPETIVKQKFKEATTISSAPHKNSLSLDEFLSFYKELTTRPEVYFLLARYASNNDSLTTDDLLLFLEAEQGLTRVGKDDCLEIISRCEPTEEGRKKKCLGIDGFTQYLMEPDCDIFDPEHSKIWQDMDQPLSHYFIASSHNTYLLDNQLSGRSKVEGYIIALQQGCRCVELDCWDGANDEPVIYHGHTLTSKILFKDVIEAIEEHAFEVSLYPVILSIENHCSVKQQQVMAKYLKEILQDKLYTSSPGENESCLPAPEALKEKILIKNKKLPCFTDDTSEAGEVSEDEEDQEDNGVINGDYTKLDRQSTRQGSFKRQTLKHDVNKNPKKTIKLARELSNLVTYCKSVAFKDFQYTSENQQFWEMCSFSETVARRLLTTSSEEFVNYNKTWLSRVYPGGKRVGSSNFNPQEIWNCGCQMVALNYQTPGVMMDLNNGKFLENGECGYVLKPSVMRDEISYFNPFTKDTIPGISPQILQIKIISGQQFPKPKGSTAKGDVIDPYVTIEVHGIPSDVAQERTRTVPHNGFNPLFDETFEFHINLPELALVRFIVQDDDFIGDAFIGQYTLPMECLLPGYRHIRLLSFTGEPLDSATLFVHVTITSFNEAGQKQRKLSLRKSKKGREYTSMKTVGVKSVDETFKSAIQPLRDGADLRDNLLTALSNFKEICGVAPRANLKQCIRLLASRLETVTETVHLELLMKDEYPFFEASGNIPDMLRRALSAIDQIVQESKNLIENGDTIYERIMHCQRSGLEWHEDLYDTCTKEGLKGKRLSKALESFAWNIRVLKGQAELLIAAKQECQEYLRQIQEASIASGLVRSVGSNL
ncbi:inactive phospholipase C-like protein 1 isoform X2 [Actinia tenebrosa]|uniref:Phosphoinositide phospholipase C n=1 Tax=Actinia tenebrosa TaxID=6105 RepID=A0A6P8JF65_ACTTE|nr:inactive phospholipase C-like protein 1 isoform X2 [Actinia tenebrosa]